MDQTQQEREGKKSRRREIRKRRKAVRSFDHMDGCPPMKLRKKKWKQRVVLLTISEQNMDLMDSRHNRFFSYIWRNKKRKICYNRFDLNDCI